MVHDLGNHDYSKHIEEVSNINENTDLCCMYYTSGSAGKPKSILLRHMNTINFCFYIFTYYRRKNVLNEFNNAIRFTFAINTVELFYPFLNSKTITLCRNDEYNNHRLLSDIIVKNKVDFMISTTTRIKNYLNVEKFRKSIKDIKLIIFGGEGATPDFLRNVIKYTDSSIYFGYGQTEVAATATVYVFPREDIINGTNITIGEPSCNFEVYILDKDFKPVPVGVEGDIYISVYSVSKGYMNQEQLTNERYIDCPYNKNGLKMYYSGDIGKWTNKWKIICIGRNNFQVKIRGQRIEISKIEKAIKEMKEIKEAIVLDKMKTNGDKYLVFYFLTETDINGSQIRKNIIKTLPLYMILNYFIKINEIPIIQNGKLDRRALPDPNINDLIVRGYEFPITEIEKKLSSNFYKVLKLMNVKLVEIRISLN